MYNVSYIVHVVYDNMDQLSFCAVLVQVMILVTDKVACVGWCLSNSKSFATIDRLACLD